MHTLDWFYRISSCHSFLSATKHAINKSLIQTSTVPLYHKSLLRYPKKEHWNSRFEVFQGPSSYSDSVEAFSKKYGLWDEGLLARHRQIISRARHRHVMNYLRRIHLRKGSRKEIGDVSARWLRMQKSKKGLFLCLYFIYCNKVYFFEPEILPFSGKVNMPVHRIETLFPRREGWVHYLLQDIWNTPRVILSWYHRTVDK